MAVETLTSRGNPRLKQIRALRQRKTRQESGLFLVEGIRHIGEAVEAGAPLEYLCYSPERLHSAFALVLLDRLRAAGTPCIAVETELFDSLADKENPQGILAVARQQPATLSGLTPNNFPWGVALVAPQDPGNVGSILRTIDAVGASGLLLLDSSVDPYHPSAVRASMGTLFWYPLVMTSFDDFAAWARRNDYHIYGTSAHGSLDYRRSGRYERPMILLMGSEREGLTPEQAAACQEMLRLPMHGRASSLNLAIATGVLLYAMLAD